MKIFPLLLLIPIMIWAQDLPLNQMEKFISEKGPIVHFENYYLQGLQAANGKFIFAKVRKVSAGGETRFFLILSANDKTSSNSAVISETELTQLLDNLLILQAAVKTGDNHADYRESKFITQDWFQMGCAYNAYDHKTIWSITLERQGDASFFFYNPGDIELNLRAALKMIQQLSGK